MSHSFDIVFDPLADREGRARTASCLVVPRDRFTGKIVQRGITARIVGLGVKARPTLSGALFFEDLPGAPPFQVELDVSRAGYLPVAAFPVDVVEPNKPPRAEPLLDLSPERVVDGETAVLRGHVERDGKEIEGARIVAALDIPGAGTTEDFETRSGKRGAFAVRVRVQTDDTAGAAPSFPLTTTAHVTAFFDGVEKTDGPKDVTDMRTESVGLIDLPT
ncbi:hypothetical protein DEA8626_03015 [Defluviimonas aquaemixtae]|uniref:Uncharacterized protein n=1 Tax=Albidovulum aquaemixtae TaxID=1542388 RepID=A0A2R8BKN5_9RHOB|nr:hypothetical protein [Defluviimonas aquaemixtae]SPH23938.1 hypothetical protein DEA8626_03015 [Defluviimonas aquaemixtae]